MAKPEKQLVAPRDDAKSVRDWNNWGDQCARGQAERRRIIEGRSDIRNRQEQTKAAPSRFARALPEPTPVVKPTKKKLIKRK